MDKVESISKNYEIFNTDNLWIAGDDIAGAELWQG